MGLLYRADVLRIFEMASVTYCMLCGNNLYKVSVTVIIYTKLSSELTLEHYSHFI